MLTRISNAACIADLVRISRRRIPSFVFNYLEAGAGNDDGVVRNEEAMRRLLLCPRRFGGVVTDTSVELFGHRYDQPFGVAPLGMANLCWPDTDLTLARLSEQHNVPYVLSTAGTTSIEKIAEVAPTVAWFQLYLSRDEAITADMMTRAWRSGIRVLVLTVDVPYPGRRNRSIRDRFSLPFVITPRLVSDLATHPCWSVATLAAGIPTLATYAKYAKSDNFEVVGKFIAQLNKNGFGWDDLRRVRDQWKGKLVVKGVLDPHDATAIREAGADGIWVSNHGGRQLESAPATIDMLRDIRIASGRNFPVLFDGGIRSGEDIIKARALGATMVFSGRCFAHGCAAGAESGAARVFEILSVELATALHQIACTRLDDVDINVLLGSILVSHGSVTSAR